MKKFFAVVAIVFGAFSANAAWLYWQVEDMTANLPNVSGPWDRADLYALDSSGQKVGSALQSAEGSDGTSDLMTFDMSALANATSYSYYVELVNSHTGHLAAYTNNPQTYDSLVAAKSIVNTKMEIVTVSIWHGGSFNAPEPTSAMLMMLGVAALGLRRKQRKQA